MEERTTRQMMKTLNLMKKLKVIVILVLILLFFQLAQFTAGELSNEVTMNGESREVSASVFTVPIVTFLALFGLIIYYSKRLSVDIRNRSDFRTLTQKEQDYVSKKAKQ